MVEQRHNNTPDAYPRPTPVIRLGDGRRSVRSRIRRYAAPIILATSIAGGAAG